MRQKINQKRQQYRTTQMQLAKMRRNTFNFWQSKITECDNLPDLDDIHKYVQIDKGPARLSSASVSKLCKQISKRRKQLQPTITET